MPDETEPISRLNKCCVAAMLHSVRYTMVLSPAHRARLGAGLFDGERMHPAVHCGGLSPSLLLCLTYAMNPH